MPENEPNKKDPNDIVKLPCPTCGGQLRYSAQKQDVVCGHCGFSKGYDESNDMVLEQSLASANQQKSQYKPKDVGKKVMSCNNCGSQLMIDNSDVSVRCNFCGSESVNEKAYDQNLIQPQGVLPFTIPKKEAVGKFKEWIKKGWFHPNKLKKLAAIGDVHGIYVPFWTYDSDSYTEWSGEAGHYYYENKQVYRDGEWKTERVRKTRWRWRSGSFNHFFNDILVVASKGMPEKIITKIYPYRLDEVINYQSELMVGWESEIYSIGLKEGFQAAKQIMDQRVRQMATRDLKSGADTHRGLSTRTDYYNQTFKHVILPVWLCSYRYNEKSFQFAVNGQTGKINGQKPLSTIKIVLFVLLILTIIAIIVVTVMYFKNN